MTKDEAKNVLMDTFKAAWCTKCVVWDEPVWSNCNEYCGAYKQVKEAIAVLEKCDDSKSFSDSAEPSIVRCKDCRWYLNNLDEDNTDEDYGVCKWRDDETPDADDFCSCGERREP